MKKAQSATEFVTLATVMFLLFSISFIYIQSLLVDFTESSKESQMLAIQQSVQKELDLASRMPSGYERRFHLPETLDGTPYSVVVQTEVPPLKDALLITFQSRSEVVFLEHDVSGLIYSGDNILRKNAGLVFN